MAGGSEVTSLNPGGEPAHYLRPFIIPANTTLFVANGRRSFLGGYGLAESTGAANAQLNIIDGQDANGRIVIPITLLPGQSVRDHFGQNHVYLESGCTIAIVSGAVSGSIWLRWP
jgi:hypothetical protein